MPVDHTHRWTIFLRDPNGQDLSKIIKKVIFKLHDTYPNPSRSIESPPFEVTETGWGEFEITLKIFFVNESSEKTIMLYHHLKLHPYGPGSEKVPPGTQPVASYIYDELVFNEPTEAMFELLTAKPGAILPAVKSPDHQYSQQTENEELDRLSSGLEKVYNQVKKIKDQIKYLEKEKQALEQGNMVPAIDNFR
jgi:YEATS domain-containing protein 4